MVLQLLQKLVELLLVTLDSARRSFPPSRETFSQSVTFGWTGGVSAMWRSLRKRWSAQEDWEGLLHSCVTIVSVQFSGWGELRVGLHEPGTQECHGDSKASN